MCEPEIFQELQRREQLGDHGFHHSLVVDREKGAQAVDYGFDRCLADRCEPVPQQLFVFVGRLYDVQPVGDPKAIRSAVSAAGLSAVGNTAWYANRPVWRSAAGF